ncbi:hypothetical protein CM15mP5_3260 [bacterium]|nr:MAG: hypothetical protein CM15mP5_3260 [bacterium]
MTTKYQGECSDSTILLMEPVGITTIEIFLKNNAWMDTPELLAHFAFGGKTDGVGTYSADGLIL